MSSAEKFKPGKAAGSTFSETTWNLVNMAVSFGVISFLPENMQPSEETQLWITGMVFAFLSAGSKYLRAWVKHGMGIDLPVLTRCVAAFAMFPFLVGCVGIGGQGLGGKTKFSLEFGESYGSEGEILEPGESEPLNSDQITLIDPTNSGSRFVVNVEAPPGVEISDIVAFEWNWNADGSGTLLINTQRDANTTQQAAAIIEVNSAWAGAMANVVSQLPAMVTPFGAVGGSAAVTQADRPMLEALREWALSQGADLP